jgi:hypothetical protein
MQIQCVVCGRLWTPVLMRLVSRMIHMTRQHQTGGMQNCTHEHLNMMHDTSWNEHAVQLFITIYAGEYLFIICFLRSRWKCFICHSLSQIVCRLNVRLHHRHAGNMLCVKLINQENLMREHGDDHPDPNVDVSFIAPHGRLVRLPDEVQLLY